MFQPEAAPRKARPLLVAVRAWLKDHDPGAVDETRALHLAISYTIVIALGVFTSRSLGLGLDILFPMAAAMTALVLITFTPAASRRAEARSFARIFAVTFSLMLMVLAIGPGESPENAAILKLMLVPITGLAFYIRRYGMEMVRIGFAIVIIMTIAAVLHPTRREMVFLLGATLEGAFVATLVRLCLPRPSAMRVFHDTVESAGVAVGGFIAQLAYAVREAKPLPVPSEALLDTIRVRVRGALTNASAERPAARGYLEAVRSRAYRLRIATQLIEECIPKEGEPGAPWRHAFATVADYLARHLQNGLSEPFPERDKTLVAIARLRQIAMAPDMNPSQQLALLRAVTAFDRLALVVSELSRLQTEGRAAFPEALPPPVLPAPAGKGLSPFTKVTIQGLIATGITTSLDFVFGLNHAYWATMTVMFVLGNSVGETYVRARYRSVGTVIGVIIGFVCIALMETNIWALAAICLAGQMIGLVTNRERYDIASAATGLSIVIALHLISGLGADGMLARIYETAIGAAIAVAVSWLVLPVYAADEIHDRVLALVRRFRRAFAEAWPRGTAATPRNMTESLSLELRVIADRLPQIGAETALGHRSAGDVIALVSTLEVLTTYLALLEDVAHRLATLSPGPEITVALEAARARTLRAFDAALGEATPASSASEASELDAALSLAMSSADEASMRRIMPIVADYLSFSEAVLRPLADLGGIVKAISLPTRRRSESTPA